MIEPLWFIILLSSLTGLLVSFYIFHKKNRREVMVCPIGSDCDSVVHSDYSKFFGIRLEILGMIYYAITFISYAFLVAVPSSYSPTSSFILILLSTQAFLFSLFLTAVQGTVLKEWCTWCLSSAFLSTLIFTASLAVSDWSFLKLLDYHAGVIFLIHLAAIALGIGAATLGDVFFLKFLKDFKISIGEAHILRTFSQVLWFALSIAILTILGLYLPNYQIASNSPQFLVEVLILLVITLNAVYLTLSVTPRLIALSFDRERFETSKEDRAKKLAFASGGVSLVSWYFLLFLSSPLPINLNTPRLTLSYIGIIIVAVGISQIIHDTVETKAKKFGY